MWHMEDTNCHTFQFYASFSLYNLYSALEKCSKKSMLFLKTKKPVYISKSYKIMLFLKVKKLKDNSCIAKIIRKQFLNCFLYIIDNTWCEQVATTENISIKWTEKVGNYSWTVS